VATTRACGDCAQGSGGVWHHGGVVCWPDKGLCFVLHPRDGLVEDGGGKF
jgi:hypothetical protein